MIALENTPLFLDPSAHPAAERALGCLFDFGAPATRPTHTVEDGVARHEIAGLILKGIGGSWANGFAYDLDDLHIAAQAAADDPEVDTLLIRVESGGGIAIGLPEAVAAIDRAKQAGVRVVAYTEGIMASAAYWVAAAADLVAAAPSARVGSVGAYTYVDDLSKMVADQGITRHVFRSGSLKALGLPGKAVTDEERAHLQEGIDILAAEFFDHVQARRAGAVPDSVFETAAVYTGAAARDHGLVDALEETEPRLLSALRMLG